ncbi:MAG TPA: carbohydrate kinase family protein, partial [Pirellulaceae bacterium]|nr:carbohydrate kinase family protein [Pirellulaceae bacterium]
MISGSIQSDSSQTAEVFVAGLATVDLIARPVELGESILPGRLVPIERVEMATGGFVCNVSRALAKLGVRVAASATIGGDATGRFVRSELQAAGVDVAAINQSSVLTTPTTVVLVDQSGARSFLFAAGAGAQLDVEETLRRAAEHPSLRWLLFGYYSL